MNLSHSIENSMKLSTHINTWNSPSFVRDSSFSTFFPLFPSRQTNKIGTKVPFPNIPPIRNLLILQYRDTFFTYNQFPIDHFIFSKLFSLLIKLSSPSNYQSIFTIHCLSCRCSLPSTSLSSPLSSSHGILSIVVEHLKV